MILNTGGRTDTVQYYSEWLLNLFCNFISHEGIVFTASTLFS